MLTFSLRNRGELVGEIRKQHRAKGCIAGDQAADGFFRQLVRHHFFGRHKPVADFFGDQATAVKAVVCSVGIDDLAVLDLVDETLDDDEQMGGLNADIEDGFARTKVGDVNTCADQSLLVRV